MCDKTSAHVLAEFADNHRVLVWILSGSLAFTTILAGLLAVLMCKISKSRSAECGGNCFQGSGKVTINTIIALLLLLLCFVSGNNLGFSADNLMNAQVLAI